ncbi:nucleoside hydrolase [Brevibacillus nitrificans]|uniref:nucleoside hydrolase n=1 Tax=Brevibacillus nitrificans TaxID=651560 RepID=UPI002E1EBB35|nr:nucleoside hydrolase [Brevibacillus nitrificans]
MQKMLMDVDTGIDDALAIAYATSLPHVELVGITTTYGMAPVEYSYRNTCKILEYAGADVPVRKGADKPLQRSRTYSGRIHGTDGMGNTLGPVKDIVSTQPAVDFMIEQIYQYKSELTIVATAPLTNLALAIAKAPEIVDMVGRVVIMGGAVMTPGNVTKFAEANIIIDPEAANIVFGSTLPITMVGLDVTRKTLLTTRDVERWKEKDDKLGKSLAPCTQFYLDAYKELHPYLQGCALHDPLAVGVAAYPDLVQTVPMFIRVDLEEDALGRTTEDLYREGSALPNTKVCVQVDADRFMKDFFHRIG